MNNSHLIITLSCRSTGSSKFCRNHTLIPLGRSLWMDLAPMTGNLLPGHKEFVSPDPRRASQTVKERGLEHIHLSLLLQVLLPTPTSDVLSCCLKGGCYVTQRVPVFISVVAYQCLCDHNAFIAVIVSQSKFDKQPSTNKLMMLLKAYRL